jgi:hypothetical protein
VSGGTDSYMIVCWDSAVGSASRKSSTTQCCGKIFDCEVQQLLGQEQRHASMLGVMH